MILAEMLYNHFEMINSRIKTFSGIIKSLILFRGSNYKNIAEEIEGDILLDSKIKSVSRFLAGNHIDTDNFYEFMSNYIPEGKVELALDRTTWELGKEVRNILVLSVSYDKIGMPLIYKTINYKGACTADDQIEVISKFSEKFGTDRIEVLTADREFDNEKIINYLDNQKINYAIRVRKTNRIIDETGERIRIEGMGDRLVRHFATKFYAVDVKFDHIKLSSGEYLSVVSNRGSKDGLESYRRRWDIESAFKGCKTNGFNMEDTHIKDKKRLENFIKCLFMAYAIVIKVGAMENHKKPIAIKRTLGCKAYSVLQYGIKAIKQAYSRAIKVFDNLITELFILCYFQPT